MAKSKSKSPRTKLVDQADKVFSKYIRLRDHAGHHIQDNEGLSKRAGFCTSCGKLVPVEGRETGDAGHFVKRGCWALRYDETNVNLQCVRCNHFLSGNDGRYAVALDSKYGKGTAKYLHDIEDEWRASGSKTLTMNELREIVEIYTRKLKEGS
jgi:hypothetical protein